MILERRLIGSLHATSKCVVSIPYQLLRVSFNSSPGRYFLSASFSSAASSSKASSLSDHQVTDINVNERDSLDRLNTSLPSVFRFDVSSEAILSPQLNRDAPRSPSFYSPKSHLTDFILLLDDTLHKLESLSPQELASLTPRRNENENENEKEEQIRWLNRIDMGDALGGMISNADYQLVMERLSALTTILPFDALRQHFPICFQQLKKVKSNLPAEESQAAAASFQMLKDKTRPPLVRQQGGLWFARVGRKSAVAKVWLSPKIATDATSSEIPELSVNGKALATYFQNPVFQQRVLRPLTLTDRLQACHVIIQVQGGGLSAQADAIQHALCRAIYSDDPEQEQNLIPAGLLVPDRRQVERKKPGQPKARKKYTWYLHS